MDVIERIERGELIARVWPFDIDFTTQESNELSAELLRLAKIGKQAQWIPISERLPEHKQLVDIWIKKYDIRETDYTFVVNEKPGVFLNLTNKYPTTINEVLYWRPSKNDRPEPPKEDSSK